MTEAEELHDWLERLGDSEKLIVVEGAKDESALESLGISRIFVLGKRPIFKTVEEIVSIAEDVIILTDLDKEGKKLYGKLSTSLQERGVVVDNFFREWLFRNTKLRQIEGIVGYLSRLKAKEPRKWGF